MSLPLHHALGQLIPTEWAGYQQHQQPLGSSPKDSLSPYPYTQSQNLGGGLPVCLTSLALEFGNGEHSEVRARSPETEQLGLHLSDLPGKWGTAPTQEGAVTLNELDAPVQGCPHIGSPQP